MRLTLPSCLLAALLFWSPLLVKLIWGKQIAKAVAASHQPAPRRAIAPPWALPRWRRPPPPAGPAGTPRKS